MLYHGHDFSAGTELLEIAYSGAEAVQSLKRGSSHMGWQMEVGRAGSSRLYVDVSVRSW